MKDDASKTREKKIARLIEQWKRSVRAAIQSTRKDKGLSQEEIGARMAWTQDIMSNIESGRRDITVAQFIVLANELGVDPEVMFRRVLKF